MLSVKLRTLAVTAALSALSSGAFARSQQDGPVFSADQIEKGITMSAAECAAYRSTVYVTAQGQGICFRYYLSTAGGASDQVVYYLSGDKSRSKSESDAAKLEYDPAKFDHAAAAMSNEYHMPAVYLARMGLDGSSGRHLRYRRTWFEVEATNLAIDAIDARHGFKSINVMGQSGGGHLTGSLVGIREDIGCAVPGSGRLAFDSEYLAKQAKKRPQLRHYNPHDRLAEVIRHSARTRILVVTDPGDKRVQSHMQAAFVREVQMGGGHIAEFFVTATDDLSHGATPYTKKVLGACLKGRSDADITAMLARLSEKRWTAYVEKHGTHADGATVPVSWGSNPSPSMASDVEPTSASAKASRHRHSRSDRADSTAPANPGIVSVTFRPDISAADLASFLSAYKVSIVNSPGADGIFTLRLDNPPSADEMQLLVDSMRSQTNIVTSVTAADAPTISRDGFE